MQSLATRILTCFGVNVKTDSVSPMDRIKYQVPVRVNVYDMSRVNEYTAAFGIGIFHSGIEVHGVEFYYAGHDSPATGIFRMVPRCVDELGRDFQFRESIIIGYTSLTRHEVYEIAHDMRHDYRGEMYRIMQKNCNHFADDFAFVICGEHIPKWINRLARVVWRLNVASSYIPRRLLTYGR